MPVNVDKNISQMHTKLHALTKRISKNRARSTVIVLAMIFIGYLVLQLAAAASNAVAIEPEAASNTLSGPAIIISDTNASQNGAVRFMQTPNNNSAIPSTFVGGYLEWWSYLLPSQIDSRYNLLFHAFATINSNGSLELPIGVNRQQLASEYKARVAAGKPVILSIGGAGGAASGLTNQSQITNFMNSINPLINEFGFSGIDWDLEENVPGGISIDGLVNVSRQLKNIHGNNFAITMAPYEGREYPYKDIARALGNDLTFVGFQFYNMDAKVTAQNAIARMEEWMNDANLRPDQFSIGFWYGPDDWHGYTVQESLMASIYEAVRAKYPTVRGTWTWGIATTDRPRGYPFVSTMNGVIY